MNHMRLEKDLLGEKEVPFDVYWGINTLRAKENFKISNTSISAYPDFIKAIVMVKKACAQANADLEVITEQQKDAIVKACDEILANNRYLDQFPIDVYQGGAGTSTNMNVNEVIANIALEILGYQKGEYQYLDPMDVVNASQSTNDVYPTGFRLAIYHYAIDLIEKLGYLKTGLENKSIEFEDILKMGRTQLQDAVPMTVGQEFKAFAESIAEEMINIQYTINLLLEINLGSTAIGNGLNTPPNYSAIAIRYLSEISGLNLKSAKNMIEATSDCGAYIMVHSAIKRAAVKISKICNDLRLLSSGPRAGLNEINLPQMQAGSSIMPGKVNPVIPEVVNQVCFKIFGNDTTVTYAADAGQLQLNVMEPVIAQALFESIELLANAVILLRDKCINGITVNAQLCQDYVYNSIGIVTYLNPFIGHHNGDMVGKICAQTGKNVKEVILALGLLSKEELEDILSIENFKNPKYKAKS